MLSSEISEENFEDLELFSGCLQKEWHRAEGNVSVYNKKEELNGGGTVGSGTHCEAKQ